MIFEHSEYFASLVSLVIGGIIGGELTRYLYKPKVVVRYQRTSPLYDGTGKFLSVKFINKGRSVATNCVATITLRGLSADNILEACDVVSEENLPNFEDSLNNDTVRKQILQRKYFRTFDDEQLCWSNLGNPCQIDINPGITAQLDVCKFQIGKGFNYIIIPSEFGWRLLRARVKALHIRGKIKICSSNEFPTIIHYI